MIDPPFVAELQLRGSNGKAGDLRGALVWLREASELGAEGGEATFLALLMGCDAWFFWVGVGGAIDQPTRLTNQPGYIP